jgi:hypothetical protein
MPGNEHQKHEMPVDGAGVPYGTVPGQPFYRTGDKNYVALGQNESPPSELPVSNGQRHELA